MWRSKITIAGIYLYTGRHEVKNDSLDPRSKDVSIRDMNESLDNGNDALLHICSGRDSVEDVSGGVVRSCVPACIAGRSVAPMASAQRTPGSRVALDCGPCLHFF